MKLIMQMSVALVLLTAGAAFAQSASESMHEAGESAESAASHAYHGTTTAVEDTALTAKVKTALHEDKVTSGAKIHVTTVASVVTLRGSVSSSDVAGHAEEVARNTNGVKGVKNKLKTP
jgi:hyperosmotically inducible periplasmic protein